MTNRSGSSRRAPTRIALIAVLGLVLAALLPVPAAFAAPPAACDNRTNNTYQAAGAEAVIVFNQGNSPHREDLIVGTLSPAAPTIPVVGASFANGQALAQPGSTADVKVRPSETRTDVNVIAELPGKNADNVVMAGAHLDSIACGPGSGPGINDDGSGSAALLRTALMMAKVKPENTVRFAWWGAEESGLIGSTAYVEGLSQAERDRIALYLNYDMVGSPNYIFMVGLHRGRDSLRGPVHRCRGARDR